MGSRIPVFSLCRIFFSAAASHFLPVIVRPYHAERSRPGVFHRQDFWITILISSSPYPPRFLAFPNFSSDPLFLLYHRLTVCAPSFLETVASYSSVFATVYCRIYVSSSLWFFVLVVCYFSPSRRSFSIFPFSSMSVLRVFYYLCYFMSTFMVLCSSSALPHSYNALVLYFLDILWFLFRSFFYQRYFLFFVLSIVVVSILLNITLALLILNSFKLLIFYFFT